MAGMKDQSNKEAATTEHWDTWARSSAAPSPGYHSPRVPPSLEPKDPKILQMHQHEPAVPVWLDSFVCSGLARVTEHVVALHVHLSMPIGYDVMHRRRAGMKEASALKMALIGAETGLGDLVANDDVSLRATCFQLMYGYPVHDPGGMID